MKALRALASFVAAGFALAASSAMAQVAVNPIVTLIESVDLTTVAAAIGVVALVVVAIALTLKGPDVAKRVIRKV